MPILTLQKRARELGRIRIGQVVAGKNGKNRPEKLDRFRLTSPSRPLLLKVAALYGGEVREWTPQNGGPQQYEVVTDAKRLPVMVPPQPVSQFYELWSGGGCVRRCDGERELLSEKPCLCDPDPERRECKPTTRLNVVLRDVEGIGVWRLESHGYYSAVELPEVADFLARAGGYVTAWLALEERTGKRDGKTQRWMVPTLEVDITPTQLLTTGGQGPGQVTAAQSAPALPSAAPVQDVDSTKTAIATAGTRDELTVLWRSIPKESMTDELRAAFTQRGHELSHADSPPAAAVTAGGDSDDLDALWRQVLASAPERWTSQQLEDDFEATTGVDPGKANADHMRAYLGVVNQEIRDES